MASFPLEGLIEPTSEVLPRRDGFQALEGVHASCHFDQATPAARAGPDVGLNGPLLLGRDALVEVGLKPGVDLGTVQSKTPPPTSPAAGSESPGGRQDPQRAAGAPAGGGTSPDRLGPVG